MVKGILKGDIQLTSQPGQGTEFELTLPVDITQTASHRRQEANAN
jgi:signal transduction histidine kinase